MIQQPDQEGAQTAPIAGPPSELCAPDETIAAESTVIAAPAWGLPAQRYQVLAEIGRGGMGVVLRVFDLDIRRPLAIKLMREPASPSQAAAKEAEERFLEEARITGQLQHPGIPPVHEIGRLADGRRYFSMKLIEGRTLAALLKERPTPQTDLPRFLKIFEQIAQTLAYAHSQAVIHRDLKPANVMVGAFGEVQVMDWGLARRLAGVQASACLSTSGSPKAQLQQEPAAEVNLWQPEVATEIPSPLEETQPATPLPNQPAHAGRSPEAERLTQFGQVMGTPAYMPPEQARGEIDALDERSDVFGLGAILCVILTGEPPYRGPNRSTTLQHAQQGDLADAKQRLHACGAEAELVALCWKCLSPDPAGRMAHAGQVAEGISAYLASVQQRLEQATLERAAAEVQAREERKRRRLAVGLAVAIVLLVLGAGATGLWYANEQMQREASRAALERDITAALEEAQRLRQGLHRHLLDERECPRLLSDLSEWRSQLRSAHEAFKRAEALAQGQRELLSPVVRDGLAALARELRADEQEWQLAAELDKIRFESSVPTQDGGAIALWRAAPKLARAFEAARYDLEHDDPAQIAARIRESAIRLPLVAALDFWALVTRDGSLRERLMEVARAADPHPWRDRVRQAEGWKDLAKLQTLAREAALAQQSPQLLSALAQRLRLAGGDAPGLLRLALIHHPRDFWLYFELGHASKQTVEQAGAFRAALAVRPESAYAYYGLGVVHYAEKKFEAAEACYRKAIELEDQYAPAYGNLGLVLAERNNFEEAIRCYEKSLELDEESAVVHSNLGSALQALGKLDEAIVHGSRAVELAPSSAAAHINLGVTQRAANQLDEAIESFRRAVDIAPQNPFAWCNLGHALTQHGQFAEGLLALKRGHQVSLRQRDWSAPSAEWVREAQQRIELDKKLCAILAGEVSLADAGEQLAFANLCLMHKKRFAAAARFFAAAFAGDPKLADVSSGNRYNAACAAALAIAGQGNDARQLAENERAALRKQALGWLQTELTAWTDLLEKTSEDAGIVARTLQHWKADPDLAGVREAAAIQKFPAEEQPAWRKLWDGVATLRNRAESDSSNPGNP